MARIQINDLSKLEEMTPEQLKELFGAGPFKPGMEALEDRVLLASRLGLGDIAQAAARPSLDTTQVSTVEPSTNAGAVQVDVAVDPRDIENLDQAMPHQHDALNGVTDGMTGTDSPTADRGEVESPEGLSHEIVLDPQEAPHDIQPWEQTEYNEAFDARGPQNPGDYAGNMSDLALGGRIEKTGVDAGAMDGSIFGVDISDDGSPRDVTPEQMAGQTDGTADSSTPADESPSQTEPQEEKSTWEKVKDVGGKVLDYVAEVIVAKLGPPGPVTTALKGPGYVEEVTGDATDLPKGAKAFKDFEKNGYWHPGMQMVDEDGGMSGGKNKNDSNKDYGEGYTAGPGSIEGFETEYAIKIHSKLNGDINWGDQVGGSKSDAGDRYSGDVGEGGFPVGTGGDNKGGFPVATSTSKSGPLPNVEQSPLKTDQIDYGEGGKPHVQQPNEQIMKDAKDTGDIDYGDRK